jgi:hypothetical protein
MILNVVLHGYQTWSLTLREHKLRVIESRALRRISEPKKKEVTGGSKNYIMRGLRNLYYSPHISSMIKLRRMKWVGHIACMDHFGEKGRREYVKVELLTVMTIKNTIFWDVMP